MFVFQCNACALVKSSDEFPLLLRTATGLNPRCCDCINKVNKRYRDTNKDKCLVAQKANYIRTRHKQLGYRRKYTAKTKKRKAEYDATYRDRNKQKIAAYKKEWELRNRNNPEFLVARVLRRRLLHCLYGYQKQEKTFDLLGCTRREFVIWIESQFSEGMTWENHGRLGWHIDHIIPCFSFDLTDESERRKCFHYTNLRPLWWYDNLKRPRNEYKHTITRLE